MLDRPTHSKSAAGSRGWLAPFRWGRVSASAAGAFLALAACDHDDAPRKPVASPPVSPVSEIGLSRIAIPGGAFSSGTEPGRFEREPDLEPRLARSALGPFEIDARPYPGGTGAPLLGLGREEAFARCAERGGRLCSELEWERACKGPEQQPFPSGRELAPACARGPGCASGFGVWGMARTREWTASDVSRRGEQWAVVKGAAEGAPAQLFRCAHRELAAGTAQAGIAFRCCFGPPNAARVIAPKLGPAFASSELALAELEGLLAASPATRDIARDLVYFDSVSARATVLSQAGRDSDGLTFTSAPLLWNPAAGVELLIVTGRSGAATSFVVAFDVLGDSSKRLASSFIMLDETGPVMLAYRPSRRGRLEFSTCWGCLGETGRVLYRDPDQTLITQP
jgi:hypothetical protein